MQHRRRIPLRFFLFYKNTQIAVRVKEFTYNIPRNRQITTYGVCVCMCICVFVLHTSVRVILGIFCCFLLEYHPNGIVMLTQRMWHTETQTLQRLTTHKALLPGREERRQQSATVPDNQGGWCFTTLSITSVI